MIVKWKDYFLSYTNRDAAQTNGDFRKLIKDVLGSAEKTPDKDEVNYVARVVARRLSTNNIVGFFDPDEIQCGDDVEEEIKKYCKASYAFIQLVEAESFHDPVGVNWCLEEFKEFSKGHLINRISGNTYGDRYYFIITDEKPTDLKPAVLTTRDYENWYQHVSKLHYISLLGLNNRQLRRRIKDEIAKKVRDLRRKVIGDVLNS